MTSKGKTLGSNGGRIGDADGVEEEGALSKVVLDAHPHFATGGNWKWTCNPVVPR